MFRFLGIMAALLIAPTAVGALVGWAFGHPWPIFAGSLVGFVVGVALIVFVLRALAQAFG